MYPYFLISSKNVSIFLFLCARASFIASAWLIFPWSMILYSTEYHSHTYIILIVILIFLHWFWSFKRQWIAFGCFTSFDKRHCFVTGFGRTCTDRRWCSFGGWCRDWWWWWLTLLGCLLLLLIVITYNEIPISFMYSNQDIQIPLGIIVLLLTNACVPSL